LTGKMFCELADCYV